MDRPLGFEKTYNLRNSKGKVRI